MYNCTTWYSACCNCSWGDNGEPHSEPIIECPCGRSTGDEEASRRGVQKIVLERKGPSAFTCAAEIISKVEMRVHCNLEKTVDALLSGLFPNYEICKMKVGNTSGEEAHSLDMDSLYDNFGGYGYKVGINGAVNYKKENYTCYDEDQRNLFENSLDATGGFHLFVYGIAETSVLQAIKQLEMEETILLTKDISKADALLGLQSKLKRSSQIQILTRSHNIPIFVTKTSALPQITKALRALVTDHFEPTRVFKIAGSSSSEKANALEETTLAIEQVVISTGEAVRLLPRLPPYPFGSD